LPAASVKLTLSNANFTDISSRCLRLDDMLRDRRVDYFGVCYGPHMPRALDDCKTCRRQQHGQPLGDRARRDGRELAAQD
jgi:hypothetical protein